MCGTLRLRGPQGCCGAKALPEQCNFDKFIVIVGSSLILGARMCGSTFLS
jgi:hypothetical protein